MTLHTGKFSAGLPVIQGLTRSILHQTAYRQPRKNAARHSKHSAAELKLPFHHRSQDIQGDLR